MIYTVRPLKDRHFLSATVRENMRLKKFRIQIQSIDQFFDEFKHTWEQIEKRKKVERNYDLSLSFSDISQLNKILSTERLRIIEAIKKKKPDSIRSLSKILGREQSNVQRDVQELAGLGVIELKRVKQKGQKRESLRPEYHWDVFEIAIGQ